MTIDQSIHQTKDKILEALNQSGLSICTMELILENILNIVHRQATETLAAQEGEINVTGQSNIHGSPDSDHSAESE